MSPPDTPPPALESRLPGSCFVSGVDAQDDERLAALALAHLMRRLGLRVAAMTPVAADARQQGGHWTSEQLARLGEAGSFGLPGTVLSPYLVPPDESPGQAAQRAGLRVDAEAVVDTYQVLATWADAVVVQGVGGLAVPLGEDLRVHDVALRMGLPVVLALGLGPGHLGRARRALDLVRATGLRLAAWVATGPAQGEAGEAQALHALERLLGPPLGRLPARSADPAQAAAHLDAERTALALGLPQAPRAGTLH